MFSLDISSSNVLSENVENQPAKNDLFGSQRDVVKMLSGGKPVCQTLEGCDKVVDKL
jgi:hypothetical protein